MGGIEWSVGDVAALIDCVAQHSADLLLASAKAAGITAAATATWKTPGVTTAFWQLIVQRGTDVSALQLALQGRTQALQRLARLVLVVSREREFEP